MILIVQWVLQLPGPGCVALLGAVKIQIEGKGSSTAPPALIEGTAQVRPMSRSMKNTEMDAFERKFRYKPTAFPVAIDVLAVCYMARGGSHCEKDGKVAMSGKGAKVVKTPPHWMIMWPFESATTKLPATPNPSGTYVMFDGTPYAHLMVYQDPKKMK